MTVPRKLLKKYDRPGPRYTSYPTAVEFTDSIGPAQYIEKLHKTNRDRPGEPVSVYVHLPFCAEQCLFCACNVVITKKQEPVRRYLDALKTEVERVSEQLPDRKKVVQFHWGGGTPTHLSEQEIEEVWNLFDRHFDIDRTGEIAIEVDPRVTSEGQMRLLKSLGFNRISFGVQDLDPKVQEAIGRNQTEDQTRRLMDQARDLEFDSINVDLVYGLPFQTSERFENTLQGIAQMRPDRLAVYSYAHVPWAKGHQNKMDTANLPTPEGKIDLYVQATEGLIAAGYTPIGMDHFALPDDELSLALAERRLFRSFMGYTVRPAPDLLGFGTSAIGEVGGAYVQNTKKLSTYWEELEKGELPVERGVDTTTEDLLRRHVIQSLMCNLFVDIPDVEHTHGINFWETFAEEQHSLSDLEQEGFLTQSDKAIEVTPLGRFFVRNIAMLFDAYRRKDEGKPVFSRTV